MDKLSGSVVRLVMGMMLLIVQVPARVLAQTQSQMQTQTQTQTQAQTQEQMRTQSQEQTLGLEPLPAGIMTLIEEIAEEGREVEELVGYYEGLMVRPLNLNAASREQLEETRLMTLFQVESLLAWRDRYGAVRSATEWALVEGFSAEVVAQLRPFFSLGEPGEARRSEQTYTLRFKKKWGQEGFFLTSKGVYEAADYAAAAVIDNDPKERFPDFVSVSGRYKGLYVGDFTARFGQGLVLWKSFAFSAFGTPSSVARRDGGLQGYRSTDESNFFRGIGYSRAFGRLAATAFISYNALDARVVDGRYTSLPTDGLHATEAERARRHTMHELVAGANATLTAGRWRFGVTGIAYRYDKANGRRVQDYNRYQLYDGLWGNLGIDAYGALGSLRLFGEAAIDAHGAPAVLAGAVWSPSYGFETSLTARCYAPAYIATHAGAWSSLSSVSNQMGALYALQLIQGGWTFRLHVDAAWHPWKRYRAEAGTWRVKGRAQLLYDFPSGTEVEARLTWSERLKGMARIQVPFGEKVTASARVEANRGGVGGYVDFRWKPSRRWDFSTRVTLWQTEDWDARLSFYESGVPQSFSVESYAGKGIGAYLVVKYAPTRRVEMWMKVQQGYIAYFVRIFIPGRMTLLAFNPLSL